MTCYLSLSLIISSLLLYGHKFSGIVSFFGAFAISFLVISKNTFSKHRSTKITFRYKVYFSLVCLVLIFALGISRYVKLANYDFSEYLKNRVMISQGEMWWVIDYLQALPQSDINLENFVSNFTNSNYTRNYSLIYLMEKAIGESLTHDIVSEHHNIYTGGFPTIFYIFGRQGPIIFSCLSGFLSAIICGYLVRKIINRQYIFIVPYFYIYLYILTILQSGEFIQILTTKFTCYLFVVLLAEYFAYKIYSRRKTKISKVCI